MRFEEHSMRWMLVRITVLGLVLWLLKLPVLLSVFVLALVFPQLYLTCRLQFVRERNRISAAASARDAELLQFLSRFRAERDSHPSSDVPRA